MNAQRFPQHAARALQLLVLLALVAVGLTTQPVHAATTLIVDPNNCTMPMATSYCTITDAVAAASNGDTIRITGGTYTESVTVNKSLTIVAAIGAPVNWIGVSDTQSPLAILPADTELNVTIRGINFEVANAHLIRANSGYPNGLRLLVEDSFFRHTAPSGSLKSGVAINNAYVSNRLNGAGAIVIRNNVFQDIHSAVSIINSRGVDVIGNTIVTRNEGVALSHFTVGINQGDHRVLGNSISGTDDARFAFNVFFGNGIGNVLPSDINGNTVAAGFTQSLIVGQFSDQGAYQLDLIDNTLLSPVLVWGTFTERMLVNGIQNNWGNNSGPEYVGNPGGTGSQLSFASAQFAFVPWKCSVGQVTLCGVPDRLVFATQPANVHRGQNLPTLIVRATDAHGYIGVNYNAQTTIGFETNPGSATLNGTTTKTADLGEASFAGISLDKVGTGYQLRATAGSGMWSGLMPAVSSSFNVVNRAPVATRSIDNQSVQVEVSWQLDGMVFTDPDGDAFTMAATRGDNSALPGWISFNQTTGIFSGTPQASDVGVTTIKVTATDSLGGANSTSFTLEVKALPNTAPVVSRPQADQTTMVNQAWSYTVPANTFSDAEGGPLSYNATLESGALPAWLSFNVATGSFSGTPPMNLWGNVIQIKVTATDPGGLSTTNTFSLRFSGSAFLPMLRR
jgi:hypothetical protein